MKLKQFYILIFVIFLECAFTKLDASYYHEMEYGEAIEMVLEKYKITEFQLIEWNPKYKTAIKNSFFEGGEKLIIKDPNKKE